jgi:hypothetical protein
VADAKEATIPQMRANDLISAPDVDMNNAEVVNELLTESVKYSITADSMGIHMPTG